MCIRDSGYHVSAVVASGEQAVTQAAAEKPDLVLMDIHLELSLIHISEPTRPY